MRTERYPSWQYFPRNAKPPEWVEAFVANVRDAEDSISTVERKTGLGSDRVLQLLGPGLRELGFDVESGKKASERIYRPVLFGSYGRPEVSYEIDAFHDGHGIVVEVEAARGARGNATYRDIDLDPAIFAFWRALVFDTSAFSRLIADALLDLDEWHRQKEIYLNADREDYLRLGFATFYLNRTNRSGALNGGVIGGKKQTGRYKIDARFNKDTLLERVRLIGLYSRRIAVSNLDGMSIIRRFAEDPDMLIYADPPYFDRSGSLYLNSFTDGDHASLADTLNGLPLTKWILTYDEVPKVHELYSERRRESFALNYSAHRVLKAREVMVYSDAIETSLWS